LGKITTEGNKLLFDRYREDCRKGLLRADNEQEKLIHKLDLLRNAIDGKNQSNFFFRWKSVSRSSRGLYIWGGVGRGKTYMMDLFFDGLQSKLKKRTHFYRFMRDVHQRMSMLEGEKNPLQRVASDLSKEFQTLCLDEFFVEDIGDAMLLLGLMEGLIKNNVVIVTTSNLEPSRLYFNGLQRQRFLPAIALLQTALDVHELGNGEDFRMSTFSDAELYLCPHGPGVEKKFSAFVRELARGHVLALRQNAVIEINGRDMLCREIGKDIVWIEFSVLCETPRSSADYVELSNLFHSVLVSNIPRLTDAKSEATRRFIALVDGLYDRGIKVLMSAAVPIPDLYCGQKFAFEFERTESRLIEMQSREYLKKTRSSFDCLNNLINSTI
jgi:cell division protein ZapE